MTLAYATLSPFKVIGSCFRDPVAFHIERDAVEEEPSVVRVPCRAVFALLAPLPIVDYSISSPHGNNVQATSRNTNSVLVLLIFSCSFFFDVLGAMSFLCVCG